MTRKTKNKNIYFNTTETPIFIVTQYHADPFGGPAIRDVTHYIGPQQGIDITILGLSKRKKHVINKKK